MGCHHLVRNALRTLGGNSMRIQTEAGPAFLHVLKFGGDADKMVFRSVGVPVFNQIASLAHCGSHPWMFRPELILQRKEDPTK
jgi:hypothetical protein